MVDVLSRSLTMGKGARFEGARRESGAEAVEADCRVDALAGPPR
jgi:hypothetical protein